MMHKQNEVRTKLYFYKIMHHNFVCLFILQSSTYRGEEMFDGHGEEVTLYYKDSCM